ncbi:MAG: MFS transporter [Hyphomicrobiaceae bacterium]
MQKPVDPGTFRTSPWMVVAALAPFGLGYFFSYLYRAVNAIVAPDLVRDIDMSASELGLLTSAYLLAFAIFQLPLGILLDRYGPRRVQTALVATGAAGALLFAFSNSVEMLTCARALIGVGFAGGLMASFKAVVIWVPEPRRALANACVMSAGALGVILSTAPMALAVSVYGWRSAFVGLAVATFVVAALIFLVVPERGQAGITPTPLATQLKEVGGIFKDRVFLALAPVLAIPAGAHVALQTLWVGPWYRDVAGLDHIAIGEHLFIMGLAFLVGVLGSGFIADRLVRHGISLLSINIGFLVVFLASQVAIILVDPVPPLLSWSVFVMTGHTAVLAYPWLASYFGAARSGRSNTAVNLLLFGAAFFVQYAVGWVIDLYPLTVGGGYQPAAYRAAFSAVLVLEVLALLWYFANLGRLRAATRNMGPKRIDGTHWETGPAS